MAPLIEVPEADRLLQHLVTGNGKEPCRLDQSYGKILREPIVADRDLPPFDRVMMDGFAIRFDELAQGNLFRISGSALAGMPRQACPDQSHTAVEVMTGSPLPEGMDTVIPVEDTLMESGDMVLRERAYPQKGQFIHQRASDYHKGTELVATGAILRSPEIGIAASCGYASVLVAKVPVISIYGTGDELVPVEDIPAPHQIRQSNLYAVKAALSAHPVIFGETGHLSDDVENETARLRNAVTRSDIVIISGAASKGRLDWIPEALNELAKKIFHGVSQRPGKPMGVWSTDACTIFALPGNPVSTLVCTHRYIIPYIQKLQGIEQPVQQVNLKQPYSFDRPLTLFLPVEQAENFVHPRPVNNSGDYAGLARSDGFIELPANGNHWTVGTNVPFYPWK